jgi:hypothetical protein
MHGNSAVRNLLVSCEAPIHAPVATKQEAEKMYWNGNRSLLVPNLGCDSATSSAVDLAAGKRPWDVMRCRGHVLTTDRIKQICWLMQSTLGVAVNCLALLAAPGHHANLWFPCQVRVRCVDPITRERGRKNEEAASLLLIPVCYRVGQTKTTQYSTPLRANEAPP